MTTLHSERVICFNCGNRNRVTVINSTNTLGPPDLDTRPAEMMRSAMWNFIHKCKYCGYCSLDLSKGTDAISEIVKSPAYRKLCKGEYLRKGASEAARYAMIIESEGDLVRAGWLSLRAAWGYDDHNKSPIAREFRIQALRLFKQAQTEGKTFVKDPGAEEAVLVDLYRRSEQFEEAMETAKQGLAKNPDSNIQNVLKFQLFLCSEQNTKCYTVQKAIDHFDTPKKEGEKKKKWWRFWK